MKTAAKIDSKKQKKKKKGSGLYTNFEDVRFHLV